MELTKTQDGSNTLYSSKYEQHFHSCRDGALSEALTKHVIPAFEFSHKEEELNVLDICFGIGYNTFATIYYLKKNNIDTKVSFYSPEFDEELIKSLKNFEYPPEFDEIKHIIEAVSNEQYYEDSQFKIEVFVGDARLYIQTLFKIDIVYQDAFSSDVNKELWTKEYFKDIVSILDFDALITTYSIATPVRLAMSENGLYIYEFNPTGKRKATIASNNLIDSDRLKLIDMEKKKLNNSDAKPLLD
jgi:tRNA U34 5-methylaminomethyl-2-thiouridine-forming methyltransferase MnmC